MRPSPPAVRDPPHSQRRRHSEPKANTEPSQPKPAPKRARSAAQPQVGGGLFFPPTDGVLATGSRAAGGGQMATTCVPAVDMTSRDQRSSASSSASSTEAPPISEEGSSMDTEELELQQHDYFNPFHQVAVAGSPLHSARLLRDRGSQRISPPPWPEDPCCQLRHSKVPITAGKRPFLNLHGCSEVAFDNHGISSTQGAPCIFGEDSRGASPHDDVEDGAWVDSRSLPANLAPSGYESTWPDGMMHFRGGLPGKRAPRKLEPLP
jgi:hypothetical protein